MAGVISVPEDHPYFRIESADNVVVVVLGGGESRFLFSYGLLVAASCNWRHSGGEKYLKDARKYSGTTSRHIAKFLAGKTAAEVGRAALVDFFTAEMARVVGAAYWVR